MISQNLGIDCKRRIEQTRDSGHDLDLMDYAIEVKRAKKKNISGWWEQTTANAATVRMKPVLAYRLDNQKWCIVMSFRDVLNGFKDTRYSDQTKTITFGLDGWFEYVRQRL